MNILQQLLKKKIIDQGKAKFVEEEVKSSGKSPEEVVVEQQMADENLVFGIKSENLNIPLKTVEAQDIPLEVLELIPEDSARYYKMIPLSRKGDVLEIGMVFPEDLRAQEALKFLARRGSFSYRTFLILPSAFENLMKQYKNLRREVGKALEELESEIKEDKKGTGKVRTPEQISEDAPITKMVAVILRTAVEGKASDIHIEPTKTALRVRFRLLGQLHSSLFLPLQVHHAVVTRIKILSNMKIDETRIPQDGRFSTTIDNTNIDFRVATFPTSLGEKIAIRILDPSAGFKSFEDLGLVGENLEKMKEALKRPFGLILATGPTGSGKTTTLYANLRALNKEDVNIVSLEDPVEYFIEGVNQSQVRPEIGYDFASGLRQILRQDPNVIMVGEVRDNETASLVIHAALTGHIVLSTLHTNNAQGVIPRLKDMGVDKYLIPSTLTLALSQRLVRNLCDACKEKVEPKKQIRDLIAKEIGKAPASFQKRVGVFADGSNGFSVFQAKGCKKCNSTGYSGRIAIYEVLVMTEELANIVLSDASETAIGEEAKRQGMVTMLQDGIEKVLNGITTIEEVLRVAEE